MGLQVQQFTVGGLKYLVKPDHRDDTPGKSQWTVSPQEEAVIFEGTINAKWVVSDVVGWGLYRQANEIKYLGVDKVRSVDVFIAKFVRDPEHVTTWHGYPAIHTGNCADVPANTVLAAWQDAKILSSAKLRKIARMQPCKL